MLGKKNEEDVNKIMVFKLSKIILLSGLIFILLFGISFVALWSFLPNSVFATDAGPNLPSTVVDDSSLGTSSWASVGSVTASDNSYASATLAPLEISHYIKATNFGFSIPGGATINGILVEWEVLGTTGINTKDNTARIVKAGVIGSTDRANATSWTSSDTFLPHGSSSDLWGTTWTPADINDSNFGAALSAIGDASNPSIAQVDSVRITVTYTVASASISGTVYTDEGTTTMGASRTVSVSINGASAAASTTTASNGTYSLTGLSLSAGDVLNVYLDNNTEKGATVTVGSGSSLTGIDIYQNDLIARCDNSCSLTNSHLDTADNNGDSDIASIYSVSGGALTLASSKSLFIPTGKTFAPGGNVSVGLNFTNNGTYTKGTETLTMTDTSSTAKTFAGGSGSYHNVTITGGGSGGLTMSGNNSFNNVTIGAPKSVTFVSGSTQTVAGTFTATGSAGNTISINASSSGLPASLSKSSGTVTADYLVLQDSSATGGAQWYAGSHSVGLTGNTGWIFDVPYVRGGSGTAPNFVQTHFRIYKDDAGLNLASPYTDEDTNVDVPVGEMVRLRFQVLNSGTVAGNITRRLEYKEDNAPWKRVMPDGVRVALVNSQNITDGEATKSLLTKTGTFASGMGKDISADADKISLPVGGYSEDEYAVVFSQVALGHSYQFRITDVGNELQSYMVFPTINPESLLLTPLHINPEDRSTIKTATPKITFDLNKLGNCRIATEDKSFDEMANDVICGPIKGYTQTCQMPNLGADGVKVLYIACQDAFGNKDSRDANHQIMYTLASSKNDTGNIMLEGVMQFLGSFKIK